MDVELILRNIDLRKDCVLLCDNMTLSAKRCNTVQHAAKKCALLLGDHTWPHCVSAL